MPEWLQKNVPTHDRIIQVVAEVFDITPTAMKRHNRKDEIVMARQMAMVLVYEFGNYSLKEVGYLLGGFDHTTVIHARCTVRDMIETNDDLFMPKYKEVLARL